MFSLDHPKWKKLLGRYRIPYDASNPLRRLELGEDVEDIWEELWEELHHQGDIGEASLAAVPHLVRIASGFAEPDWNMYALVSTIEIERHQKTNPRLPRWLLKSYQDAWDNLLGLGLHDLQKTEDPLTVQCILGAIALAKGQLKLGAMLSYLDDGQLDEHLEKCLAWSRSYK